MTSSPPVPRRRLARQLRAMREAAGLTLEVAAPKLELSKSALGRVETGQTQATVHLVRSMMDLYQRYDEDVLDMVREARQPGWWQGYRIANPEYLAWESCAQRVNQVAVARIPDLLQTEPYTEAWLSVDRCEEPDPCTLRRRIDHEIWSRDMRQRRFADVAALGLTVVITETALRHEVAGAQVMASQWKHLAQAASWPAVTLRVLPDSAEERTLCTSGFSLVEFADPVDPPQLYVDSPIGLLRIDTPYRIAQARMRFTQMCTASLSPLASIEFIECVARGVPDAEFAGKGGRR